MCSDAGSANRAKGQPQLQDLNAMMKDYMDGLSVKVFRTFNASSTLDRLLWEPSQSQGLAAMQGDYHRANKEVGTEVLWFCCTSAI